MNAAYARLSEDGVVIYESDDDIELSMVKLTNSVKELILSDLSSHESVSLML